VFSQAVSNQCTVQGRSTVDHKDASCAILIQGFPDQRIRLEGLDGGYTAAERCQAAVVSAKVLMDVAVICNSTRHKKSTERAVRLLGRGLTRFARRL